VGADDLLWLRRATPGDELAALHRDQSVAIYTLYSMDVNLSYFGLMPHAIGHGTGYALQTAINEAWRRGARGMTVKTRTADHPRALPKYLRAGYFVVREARETWSIPTSLNMRITSRLKL
jgi:hypothetical protein